VELFGGHGSTAVIAGYTVFREQERSLPDRADDTAAFLDFKDGEGESLDSFECKQFVPVQVFDNKDRKPEESVDGTPKYITANRSIPPEWFVLFTPQAAQSRFVPA
jgi:hypothetical protein